VDSNPHIVPIQRRTLRLLFLTQIVGGVGMTVGASVGALLAAELAGVRLSGVAQSANVVGAALFALPAAAIVQRRGRRPSLAAGYAIAAAGSLVVLLAAVRGSVPLLFAGLFLFGGANAAGLQARYAAVDLAPAAARGRDLSLVVWATTLGAVVGPALAAPAGAALHGYGIPTLAGPFLLSALLFALAALLILLLLTPDPAMVARMTVDTPGAPAAGARPTGVRAALPVILSRPAARLGVGATAIGHVVMIGVMTMAPVHVRSAGHDPAHTLRIVGVIPQLAHRGDVRVRAGLRLAHRPSRPAAGRRRRHRPAAARVRGDGDGGTGYGAARGRADAARPRLVGDDGGGVHAAERRSARRAQGLGAGTVGPDDGAGGGVGGRDLGSGGRRLGLSHADAARGVGDRAARGAPAGV
jgi:MFS family permease